MTMRHSFLAHKTIYFCPLEPKSPYIILVSDLRIKKYSIIFFAFFEWSFENMFISRAGARSAAWGSVLSCSWGLCCRSWVALGTYVGGLVLLLGPMWAVLGRSWSLCWRSWVALGAYVGDLRQVLGSMLPGPEGPEPREPREGPEGPDLPEGPVRIFSVDICEIFETTTLTWNFDLELRV